MPEGPCFLGFQRPPLIIIKHDSRDLTSSFGRNWSRKPSHKLCSSQPRPVRTCQWPPTWVSPVSAQGRSECHVCFLTCHSRRRTLSHPTSTIPVPAAFNESTTKAFLFVHYKTFQLPCLCLSLCQMQVVCVSCCFCDKSPQIWWLETTKIYDFTVLEVRSPKWVLPGWSEGVGRAAVLVEVLLEDPCPILQPLQAVRVPGLLAASVRCSSLY